MTFFINLETSEIIHAVEGKSVESVSPFLQKLEREASNFKALAMDMNAAYASAVRQYLPKVDVVFYRFHVVSLLNTTIDEIRRSQQSKCNAVGLKVIKGCRFLLLGNYGELPSTQQERLNRLLLVKQPLALAHTMKEQIRLLWNKLTKEDGAFFLLRWIVDTTETGIVELARVGKTLLRRGQGLLNYFKHRITNGKMEGINNKIKTMKRQAYGFRDIDYFKLRLYNLLKTRYSFGG